jgi:hypothetical protein
MVLLWRQVHRLRCHRSMIIDRQGKSCLLYGARGATGGSCAFLDNYALQDHEQGIRP